MLKNMNDSYIVNLSSKIRSLLFKKRMSQAELAKEIGMSASVMSSRIHGKSTFSVPEIKNIAKVLSVSVDYLLSEGK